MGNAHGNERRKSTDAGNAFNIGHGGSGKGGGGGGGGLNSGNKRGSLPNHEDMIVGPVDITAGVHSRNQVSQQGLKWSSLCVKIPS